ncbi:MAG: hypothetical protein ACFBWO_10075 [Paracoccaceae bacterium]
MLLVRLFFLSLCLSLVASLGSLVAERVDPQAGLRVAATPAP